MGDEEAEGVRPLADLEHSRTHHRSVYKSCAYVSNICVHADSSANKPMAVSRKPRLPLIVTKLTLPCARVQIVFAHEGNLKQLVQEKGLVKGSQEDLAAICADEGVRKAVLAEINAVGKKAGFKPLEVSIRARACAVGREKSELTGLVSIPSSLADLANGGPHRGGVDASEWFDNCSC